jgi:hypothetical protein
MKTGVSGYIFLVTFSTQCVPVIEQDDLSVHFLKDAIPAIRQLRPNNGISIH